MTFRERGLLAGLAVMLVLGAVYLHVQADTSQVSGASATQVVSQPVHPPAIQPRQPFVLPFSKDIAAFAAAVRNAEKQPDLLQRCLAYPDPPGSHWNHEAVVEYCSYRNQPTISFEEVKDLIKQGNAIELDRRMNEALQAQMTQPDARGRLDHIFLNDFDDGSFAVRELLDAWKRDSSHSAYAYAASGYAYVAMAHEQRGGKFAKDTPQDKMDSMDRLLRQADADLQHAIRLNPRITPVYVAMIHAAGLEFGRDYAMRAAGQGLRVDPVNWSIYNEMMWIAQPQWLGSLEAMQGVADAALKHANQNPLLWMEKQAVAQYQVNADGCNCAPPPNAFNFPSAMDELTRGSELAAAGNTAADQGEAPMAVVYLSEAIRFQPEASLRRQRVEQLALVGERQMALDEANELIAAAPKDANNYIARGHAYLDMGDARHGEQDLETALSLNPDDDETLGMLGSIYTNETHEWDKAWDIADRFIRKYPDSPGGWMMRATIQENQPRAGLQDTYQYFLEHFGNDPQMKWQIVHMHALLSKAGAVASPNRR
jgi:tetratricopeptide (TPR) repeat protein